MQLSDEHISSFKDLYLRVFGKEITKTESREKAIKLIRLMRVVYKPMTKAELAQTQDRKTALTKRGELRD